MVAAFPWEAASRVFGLVGGNLHVCEDGQNLPFRRSHVGPDLHAVGSVSRLQIEGGLFESLMVGLIFGAPAATNKRAEAPQV